MVIQVEMEFFVSLKKDHKKRINIMAKSSPLGVGGITPFEKKGRHSILDYQ